MVSTHDSRLSGPGLNLGWGHCVVFLGKKLHSDSASLHLGVQMGTGEFNAGGNPAMARLASHPGGSENIPSHFMLQISGLKLQPDGPLSSYVDFLIEDLQLDRSGTTQVPCSCC